MRQRETALQHRTGDRSQNVLELQQYFLVNQHPASYSSGREVDSLQSQDEVSGLACQLAHARLVA